MPSENISPYPRVNNDVPLLFPSHERPVVVAQCERMCRQIVECRGFNMRWVGQQGGRGYCDIMEPLAEPVHQADSGVSHYSVCPAQMKYNAAFDSCYTGMQIPGKPWQEAENHCQSLHPDAHLIEINSQEEQEFMIDVMGGFGCWLGGKRHFNGGQDDVLWMQTGNKVLEQWNNFGQGQPDGSGHCLAAQGLDAHHWFEISCNQSKRFMCKITLN